MALWGYAAFNRNGGGFRVFSVGILFAPPLQHGMQKFTEI